MFFFRRSSPIGVSHSGDSLTSYNSPNNLRHQSASPLVSHNNSSSSYGTLQSVSIDEFLRVTGLNERYALAFRRQGVKNLAALCRLSQADLASIGFRLEEQQRICEAIQRWQQATLPRRNYQPNAASSSSTLITQSPAYHLNQNKQQHSNEGFFV